MPLYRVIKSTGSNSTVLSLDGTNYDISDSDSLQNFLNKVVDDGYQIQSIRYDPGASATQKLVRVVLEQTYLLRLRKLDGSELKDPATNKPILLGSPTMPSVGEWIRDPKALGGDPANRGWKVRSLMWENFASGTLRVFIEDEANWAD